MKKVIKSLLIFILILIIIGCSNKEEINNNYNDQEEKINDTNNSNEVVKQMKLIINDIEYTINLEENETVKKFIDILPQELTMSELNGNEKFVYLDTSFPINSYNPKRINAGDVMLYNDNCLVLFYKSFDTSYSYTKIGHIENLPNLGNSSINVKFEK